MNGGGRRSRRQSCFGVYCCIEKCAEKVSTSATLEAGDDDDEASEQNYGDDDHDGVLSRM